MYVANASGRGVMQEITHKKHPMVTAIQACHNDSQIMLQQRKDKKRLHSNLRTLIALQDKAKTEYSPYIYMESIEK